MNNPMVLTLFSLVFILLGIYNVFSGSKRIREAYARGITLIWYKQIHILTGVEYILLALVFIVSTLYRSGEIPPALSKIVPPFYVVLLVAAAVLAALVIRQGIVNARTTRANSIASSSIKSNGTSTIVKQTEVGEVSVENGTTLDRRRERRRNAAAARRRRAGRA